MECAYFLFHGRYDNFGCMNKETLTNCSFDFPNSMGSDSSIYIIICLLGVGLSMDSASHTMIVDREEWSIQVSLPSYLFCLEG